MCIRDSNVFRFLLNEMTSHKTVSDTAATKAIQASGPQVCQIPLLFLVLNFLTGRRTGICFAFHPSDTNGLGDKNLEHLLAAYTPRQKSLDAIHIARAVFRRWL